MARKIFTIIAAHPVDVKDHELPRVRVDQYVIEGKNLSEAFAGIKDFAGIVDATAVYGLECKCLLMTPDSAMRREETLSNWERWTTFVRKGEPGFGFPKWQLLASGPETFQQRRDRQLAEYMAAHKVAA